ncbi:MAG: hypothetical protein HKN67_05360, partial [Saprospiraceae bacterium]|nr:hypothetical protein [Saprospiraceae bacterium]
MKVDIAQAIREVLDERQAVTLEGLGSLKLVNTPAAFGELRKSILPPGVDLVFEETTSSNIALIENICLRYDILPNKAEKYIEKFSVTILNTLANFGKVHITGVGSIQRTNEGEINFVADKDFVGQYYKGLPEIPIRLAPKKKPVQVAPVGDITPKEVPEKTKIDDIPEISQKPAFQQSDAVDSIQAETIDKTEVKPAPVLPEQKFASAPAQQSEALKYLKTDRERGIWWPIFWIILFILLLFLLLKTCGVFSGNDDKNAEPVSTPDPIELAEQSPNFSPETESSDTESALVLPDQCIIITGVFSAGANVRRMDEKLENAGYTVY